MDARKKCVLSAGKTMSIKFLVLGGGYFGFQTLGGGGVPITGTISIQRAGAKVRIHISKIIPQKYFPVFALMRIQAPHVFVQKLIPQEFFPACIGFVPGGIFMGARIFLALNVWRQFWCVAGKEPGCPELLESPWTSQTSHKLLLKLLGDFSRCRFYQGRTKIQPKVFSDTEVFEYPLGSWTSAPSGHGCPRPNACFLQDFEGPDRSFGPGYPR